MCCLKQSEGELASCLSKKTYLFRVNNVTSCVITHYAFKSCWLESLVVELLARLRILKVDLFPKKLSCIFVASTFAIFMRLSCQ